MQRLNPFRGLEHPREVWAWGMFDLANQSFTLLINTLLFAIFFTEVVMVGYHRSDFVWSLFGSISMGIVVLVSPIVGAFADYRACKKRLLLTTGAACAILTCLLAALPQGDPLTPFGLAFILAALVYIPANIAFNLGENVLAGFLPEIANRKNIGRVSAIGWSMGYVGALILLSISAIFAFATGMQHGQDMRPLLLFAGLWFAVMMIPTALFLNERAVPRCPHNERLTTSIGQSFTRLGTTIKQAALHRDLALLLVAFLIYGMGVQVIVFFAGKIVRSDFGFELPQQVLFVAQITVTAGIGAALTGIYQDKLGHKKTLLIFLLIWVATSLGMLWLTIIVAAAAPGHTVPKWPVWIVGNGVGLGLGGVGTATRALVGTLTPKHKTAEFFGLWGFTYKLAGVVGLPIYGYARDAIGSTASAIVLTTYFLVGGILLFFVSVRRGSIAARRADRTESKQSNHTTN